MEPRFQVVSTEDCYVHSDLHRPPPDMSVATLPFSIKETLPASNPHQMIEESVDPPGLFVSAVTTRSLQRLRTPVASSAPPPPPILPVSPSKADKKALRASKVPARKKARQARKPRSRDLILYEVEKTLSHRISSAGSDNREFLIQWKPGPDGKTYDPSWQPENGLSVGTLSAYWDRLMEESEISDPLLPVPSSEFILPDSRRVDAHLPLPRDNFRDALPFADDDSSSRQRPDS